MPLKPPPGGWLTQRLRLRPEFLLAGKYQIMAPLGWGYEGEVYLVHEEGTDVERTAKIFYPQRNVRNHALKAYARKLHTLRHCPMVIQYHTREILDYQGIKFSFLVSEYVEGELLEHFLARQPGKRLTPFQAVHLLHALAHGIECIHGLGEYHGDLHDGNIIVQRFGLTFDLKLLDMFNWGKGKVGNMQFDITQMIRVFHQTLGGPQRYANQPEQVKEICCGLKTSLILKKFRSAAALRTHLQQLEWD